VTAAAVRSAAAELVALAVRMREDWDEPEIRHAMVTCQSAGWRFPEYALELVRLAVIEGSKPSDLAHVRSQGKRKGTRADVRPCAPELVALVMAMRDDWDELAVRRALAVTHGAGWAVGQAVLELVRLAVIRDSEPRDLAAAASGPFGMRSLGDRRG
jgi:hypothetical protein